MERPQTYAAGQVKSTTKIGGRHAPSEDQPEAHQSSLASGKLQEGLVRPAGVEPATTSLEGQRE
jgi:hypothetical protein